MKRVYICTPYSASEDRTISDNIKHAENVCKGIKEKYPDVDPIISHGKLTGLDDDAQREMIMFKCKEMIRTCKEVWVCSDRISRGMAEEMIIAFDNGIDVYNMGGSV